MLFFLYRIRAPSRRPSPQSISFQYPSPGLVSLYTVMVHCFTAAHAFTSGSPSILLPCSTRRAYLGFCASYGGSSSTSVLAF